MDRSHFPVSVSGGVAYTQITRADGILQQMRWHADADTGQLATIELAILPDANDTGPGWTFYTRASANVADQFDTGMAPLATANDRIRLTVTPADTGVAFSANCYLWHGA